MCVLGEENVGMFIKQYNLTSGEDKANSFINFNRIWIKPSGTSKMWFTTELLFCHTQLPRARVLCASKMVVVALLCFSLHLGSLKTSWYKLFSVDAADEFITKTYNFHGEGTRKWGRISFTFLWFGFFFKFLNTNNSPAYEL